jgi:hypothetical protein
MAATTAKRGGPATATLHGSSTRDGITIHDQHRRCNERAQTLSHSQGPVIQFPKGGKISVNNRVESNSLMPARFGSRALTRMPLFICWLRNRFPKERLLMTKVDCKSAYRRVHLQRTTTLRLSTCTAGKVLVALRMTFGGAER